MGCATFDGKPRICQNVDREELRVMHFQDSFYKSLTPEQNALAHANEYDLDTPSSIDFDLLVEKLKELKQGSVVSERQSSEREEQSNIFPGRKRTDIPIYSFQEHQRLSKTLSIYSPHVVILEGILALHDPRILEMLDMKIFVEADGDLCLSRRSKALVLRFFV
jgi:uridine kinase